MRKPSGIVIECPPPVRRWISQALRFYVDAAYPPGSGDCAQVARETLLNSAADVERNTPTVTVSRRQRAMFEAAINHYFDNLEYQEDPPSSGQRGLVLEAARGVVITDKDLGDPE